MCFGHEFSESLMTATECIGLMGFPVMPEQVAACGVSSQFALMDVLPPNTRTRRSMTSQAGNAMMVCQAGSIFMMVALMTHKKNQQLILDCLEAGEAAEG